MREVILAIEAYQRRTGNLPAGLDVLSEKDGLPPDLDLSIYTFSPPGFNWMRDKRWVLAAPPDPGKDGMLVVGKLSGIVDVFAVENLTDSGLLKSSY
ncbi:MAG: hypothetical protein KAX19_07310 [Candidatus Brocadiae bacterium]|nr:hypothetical protein [Candidatus Brocadiia bacterium]